MLSLERRFGFMRVAVITTSYPVFDGDPAGHFVASEVRELERRGAEVVVIRPSPGGAFGWPGAAARIRDRPTRALEVAVWAVTAARALRRLAPNRIVAHWAVPSAWPVACGARRTSLEAVSHGADVRFLRALPGPARSRIVGHLVRRVDSWRFVSTSLRDDLLSSLSAEMAAALDRVACVAASPLGAVAVSDSDVRARREGVGARRLYVCAGRLIPSKAVDRIIDYVATQRSEAGRAPVLVVLGDGPERARLEEKARSTGAVEVRFLGKTTRPEALTWIGAADEVVHASRAEGLSTVIREAEHLGVPVTILR